VIDDSIRVRMDVSSPAPAALFPFKARYVEHAVCLATSLVLGLSSDDGLYNSRSLVLLYLCALAICVEEVAVIPGVLWHSSPGGQASTKQRSVFRHSSNPGLVLGSCVMPWMCMVLRADQMFASSVLAGVVLLLYYAAVDSHQQYFPRRYPSAGFRSIRLGEKLRKFAAKTLDMARVLSICCWIVGWSSVQLAVWDNTEDGILVTTMASISFGMNFFLRWLVPGTCTMGESVAISAAVVGVLGETCAGLSGTEVDVRRGGDRVVGVVVSVGVLTFIAALIRVQKLRKGFSMASLLLAALSYAVLLHLATLVVPQTGSSFVSSSAHWQYFLVYWCACLLVSLPFMALMKSYGVRNIIVRKGFHLLALLLFVPPLGFESSPLPLALAVALVGFLALEIIRLGDISLPLGLETTIHGFMAAFVDSRDTQGELYVTHITLLVGLAIPIWLQDGRVAVDIDGLGKSKDILRFAGIVATGVGDAMASIVGSLYGSRTVAADTNKTVQGTWACFVSMLLSWSAICVWLDVGLEKREWALIACATILSSLLEAITDQFDNVFVAVQYYCLMRSILSVYV
jgi:dolichol kinase